MVFGMLAIRARSWGWLGSARSAPGCSLSCHLLASDEALLRESERFTRLLIAAAVLSLLVLAGWGLAMPETLAILAPVGLAAGFAIHLALRIADAKRALQENLRLRGLGGRHEQLSAQKRPRTLPPRR